MSPAAQVYVATIREVRPSATAAARRSGRAARRVRRARRRDDDRRRRPSRGRQRAARRGGGAASPTSGPRPSTRTSRTCPCATTVCCMAVGELTPDGDPVVDGGRGLPLRTATGRRRSSASPSDSSQLGRAPRRRSCRAPDVRAARPGARARLTAGPAARAGRRARRPGPAPTRCHRVSIGQVDSAVERSSSMRLDRLGGQRHAGGAGEVDDAGQLRDGQAVELASVPLGGVLEAAAGQLDRIERVADVGPLGLLQRAHVEHGRRDETDGDDGQADLDRDRRSPSRRSRRATHATWKRVSKRAKARPWVAVGARVWTRESKPWRATEPAPPSTTATSSTSGLDGPRAPKAATMASTIERPADQTVLAVAPAQHRRDGVAGERAGAVERRPSRRTSTPARSRAAGRRRGRRRRTRPRRGPP